MLKYLTWDNTFRAFFFGAGLAWGASIGIEIIDRRFDGPDRDYCMKIGGILVEPEWMGEWLCVAQESVIDFMTETKGAIRRNGEENEEENG